MKLDLKVGGVYKDSFGNSWDVCGVSGGSEGLRFYAKSEALNISQQFLQDGTFVLDEKNLCNLVVEVKETSISKRILELANILVLTCPNTLGVDTFQHMIKNELNLRGVE